MRRSWLLPCLSCVLCAQAPLPVETAITRVRLHPDEAWVTRSGSVSVKGRGTYVLQLAGLPPGLGLDDLRAEVSGPEGCRLGDLSLQSEARVVQETPEWKALEAQREAQRDQRDGLETEREAIRQELDYLKSLQATEDKELSARLPLTQPNAASLIEVGKGLRGRSAELLLRDRKLKRELEKLAQEEQRLQAEMTKREAGRRTAPSRVGVEVTTPGGGELQVSLSYRTRAARWSPAYEARLGEGRLDLALYAAVTQTSGEDWSGVQLEISNVRASRSLALPGFGGPLELGWTKEPPAVSEGYGRLDRRAAEAATVVVASSAQNMYLPAPPPPPPPPRPKPAAEADTRVIEEAKGLATTFMLDGLKEVPSDGEPHRFRVKAQSLEPELALVAAPRLDPTVYQVVRFAAPQGFPLFPGMPVVQFAGNQRLGQAPLAIPKPGQPFEMGFGPYRGLRVSLLRLDSKSETVGAFSKERQWTLKERFELSNDTAEPLSVELRDRIVKSTTEQVKVALTPDTTPGSQEKLPGLRSWQLQVPAKASGSVLLGTQVRAPQEGALEGLEGLGLEE